jgi:hypothetical protein
MLHCLCQNARYNTVIWSQWRVCVPSRRTLTTLSKMSSHRTSLPPSLTSWYLVFGKSSVPVSFRRPVGKSMYRTGFLESNFASVPCTQVVIIAIIEVRKVQIMQVHHHGVYRQVTTVTLTILPPTTGWTSALMWNRYLQEQCATRWPWMWRSQRCSRADVWRRLSDQSAVTCPCMQAHLPLRVELFFTMSLPSADARSAVSSEQCAGSAAQQQTWCLCLSRSAAACT